MQKHNKKWVESARVGGEWVPRRWRVGGGRVGAGYVSAALSIVDLAEVSQ